MYCTGVSSNSFSTPSPRPSTLFYVKKSSNIIKGVEYGGTRMSSTEKSLETHRPSAIYSITTNKLSITKEIEMKKAELIIKNNKASLWRERWFWSSNAKDIGTTYLIYAFLSGLVGTAFSVLIRLELSRPGVQFIHDNQLYNSIITAHAIVMIFFMVMPAMIGGFGNFLLPLMAGGPDMAYPRLNNVSFWLLIPSIILFLFANGIENGAGTGLNSLPPFIRNSKP